MINHNELQVRLMTEGFSVATYRQFSIKTKLGSQSTEILWSGDRNWLIKPSYTYLSFKEFFFSFISCVLEIKVLS